MQVRSTRGTLQTPERLDTRVGVVAGLYVAALLSPALVLVVVRWLDLGSGQLALGLLGAVGMVLTAVVAWQVTRRGGLVAWFNSTWVALLVPAVGLVPMLAYFVLMITHLALYVAELEAENAASLVGFTGFFLGIAAGCLGSVLVYMARARLVDATVDDGDVDVEWTAGWPRRARFKFAIGTLVVLGSLFGLAFQQLGWRATQTLFPGGIALALGINNLTSEHTYRVTPAGLEQRRGKRWFVSRQLTPWSQFEGFSVTEDAITLHRPLPHVDVRCSRWDVTIAEEDVVAALEAHLDRRDS